MTAVANNAPFRIRSIMEPKCRPVAAGHDFSKWSSTRRSKLSPSSVLASSFILPCGFNRAMVRRRSLINGVCNASNPVTDFERFDKDCVFSRPPAPATWSRFDVHHYCLESCLRGSLFCRLERSFLLGIMAKNERHVGSRAETSGEADRSVSRYFSMKVFLSNCTAVEPTPIAAVTRPLLLRMGTASVRKPTSSS